MWLRREKKIQIIRNFVGFRRGLPTCSEIRPICKYSSSIVKVKNFVYSNHKLYFLTFEKFWCKPRMNKLSILPGLCVSATCTAFRECTVHAVCSCMAQFVFSSNEKLQFCRGFEKTCQQRNPIICHSFVERV